LRLIADSLSFRYKGMFAPLYSDVSYEWAAGDLGAIVGPSGAGKSTLLDLLGGLRSAEAGSVRLHVDNESGSETLGAAAHRRCCSWVLQANTVFSGRTVIDNVTISRRVKADRRSDESGDASRVLSQLGLGEKEGRLVDSLSGGELQRVTIARCILAETGVILADEPTGNLDAANTALVVSALRAAADSGKMVIVATHDRAVFDKCDSVLSLR
jgi:ABC-type lipoprotein export system ATPase subunit